MQLFRGAGGCRDSPQEVQVRIFSRVLGPHAGEGEIGEAVSRTGTRWFNEFDMQVTCLRPP